MDKLNEFTQKFQAQYIDGADIKITADTDFRQIGSWDSLTGMAVLVMIQDEYGIDIPIDKFKGLLTVKDVYNYIHKELKNKNESFLDT
mgnify:CR=1 FL=1